MARTSVVPDLIDAIVAQMGATFAAAGSGFTNVSVLDGPGLSDAVGDSLQVGVPDPAAVDGPVTSASTAETPGPMAAGRPRDEIGHITCAAESWNGDGVAKKARDRVYAIAGAVANQIRTSSDTKWGVTGVLWTSYGTATTFNQDQDSNGAHAVLTFRIAFRARL